MEKFQREVTKGHSKAKRALIGQGGQSNKPPYTNKPSFKRAKSAPPGFGAIGEATLGLPGGIAAGIKAYIPSSFYSSAMQLAAKSSKVYKDIINDTKISQEIENQAKKDKAEQEKKNCTATDVYDLATVIVLRILALKKNPQEEYKNTSSEWRDTVERLKKGDTSQPLQTNVNYADVITKLETEKDINNLYPKLKEILTSLKDNNNSGYVEFATTFLSKFQEFEKENIGTTTTPASSPTITTEASLKKSNNSIRVRLIKKVDEDKLISPEQVKKDRRKRIHKPKEREREKHTGIIPPKLAVFYEY